MMYMSEKAMYPKTKLFRYLALAGNLSLLGWVVAWQMTLSPHPHLDNVTLAIVWAVPLLLPLPGILIGKPYTHAWANFILMLYFLHALTILYVDGGERLLAAVELLLTTIGFAGNILFTRFRAKELGIKLKRLSEVEKNEKAKFE
ncbi:Predicted membrane protein [Vibrio chagasii]|nr:Predicted membrane protein [Vibrio chagasii]CAH6921293.1 Predicted membrane protein [Vibrio chagasii]